MESLDSTYGAALIGLIASAVLYGVTLLQTFLYYKQYPSDSWLIKLMVFVLWVLDTLHLFLCTVAIYTYLITNYSNPPALQKSTWSMNLQTDCNGLIGLIVECFFARRVWIISQNALLALIIVILACIHFGLGVVFTVDGFLLVNTDRFPKLVWVTTTGIGSAAVADIIIAVSLCYYLTKSRTGLARTDSLITTLMVYSLTTGLITSVIAVIIVISFAVQPTKYIWLGFFWLIGKCYVNSLLAALSGFITPSYFSDAPNSLLNSLNSRGSLREQAAPPDGTFLQLTPFRAQTPVSEISTYNKENVLSVNAQKQIVTRTKYEYIISTPQTA